jgi:hypothetical protein
MSKNSISKARKSPLKVVIQGTKEKLTSQAGLVPVVKFLDKIGLTGVVKSTVEHLRGENATYELSDVVNLTTVGIVGGARYLSGVATVWSDRVLRRLGGWLRIPDDTTLGRIFKGLDQKHVVQLEVVNHKLRGRVWKKALRSGKSKVRALPNLWIDGDSTVKTVYGKQEGAQKGFNSHKKGALSYHPLLAFCTETKEILQGWFRCGSAYTSNGIVEFMKQLVAHLPRGLRVIFRADSGFFIGALLDFLESLGFGYLIKVKMKNLIELLEKQKWTAVQGQPGWEQCEFTYACKNWEKKRRFVAVRKEKPKKESGQLQLIEMKDYEYFCYVVSEKFTPWQTHKKYGERATSETWIDEAKNQMALSHIKTDNFIANAALFQCAILAYNTVKWMALLSGNTTIVRWEIQTVRAFLIRVAGKLTGGSRQQKLKVPEECLYPRQWDDWVEVGLG